MLNYFHLLSLRGKVTKVGDRLYYSPHSSCFLARGNSDGNNRRMVNMKEKLMFVFSYKELYNARSPYYSNSNPAIKTYAFYGLSFSSPSRSKATARSRCLLDTIFSHQFYLVVRMCTQPDSTGVPSCFSRCASKGFLQLCHILMQKRMKDPSADKRGEAG